MCPRVDLELSMEPSLSLNSQSTASASRLQVCVTIPSSKHTLSYIPIFIKILCFNFHEMTSSKSFLKNPSLLQLKKNLCFKMKFLNIETYHYNSTNVFKSTMSYTAILNGIASKSKGLSKNTTKHSSMLTLPPLA